MHRPMTKTEWDNPNISDRIKKQTGHQRELNHGPKPMTPISWFNHKGCTKCMRIAQTISIGLKSCYTKNRRTFLEKWQPKGRWNPRWWGSSHVEIFRWKTTFVLSEFRLQFSTTQNVYTVPNFFFVSIYFVCICLRSTSIVIRDSVTTVDGFFWVYANIWCAFRL